MKTKLIYSGIGFLIVTLLSGLYINQFHYMAADGTLHESLATPLAAISFWLGSFALFAALVLYIIGYLKRPQETNAL